MRKWHTALMSLAMLAAIYLAFCGEPVVTVEVRFADDGVAPVDAAEGDAGPDVQPLDGGRLYVVDHEGKLVGTVISRAHRLAEYNELYDAVTVYNPSYGLFFSIKMTNAKVLRPAKALFANANCTGTASVRATCPDCLSGYDLGFEHGGVWYRIPGGQERVQVSYTSYIADEPDAICTAHGNSSTWVYKAVEISPPETPGQFVPPLRFVWGN